MTTNQIEILAIVSVLINVTLLCFAVWYNRRLQKSTRSIEKDDRTNYEVLADVRAAVGCSYEGFFQWVAQLHSRGYAGGADIDQLRRMGVPIVKWLRNSTGMDDTRKFYVPYTTREIEECFKENTGPSTDFYKIHNRQKKSGFITGSASQAYEAEFLSVWEDELIRTGVVDGPIFGKTDERKNGSVKS